MSIFEFRKSLRHDLWVTFERSCGACNQVNFGHKNNALRTPYMKCPFWPVAPSASRNSRKARWSL